MDRSRFGTIWSGGTRARSPWPCRRTCAQSL